MNLLTLVSALSVVATIAIMLAIVVVITKVIHFGVINLVGWAIAIAVAAVTFGPVMMGLRKLLFSLLNFLQIG